MQSNETTTLHYIRPFFSHSLKFGNYRKLFYLFVTFIPIYAFSSTNLLRSVLQLISVYWILCPAAGWVGLSLEV